MFHIAERKSDPLRLTVPGGANIGGANTHRFAFNRWRFRARLFAHSDLEPKQRQEVHNALRTNCRTPLKPVNVETSSRCTNQYFRARAKTAAARTAASSHHTALPFSFRQEMASAPMAPRGKRASVAGYAAVDSAPAMHKIAAVSNENTRLLDRYRAIPVSRTIGGRIRE